MEDIGYLSTYWLFVNILDTCLHIGYLSTYLEELFQELNTKMKCYRTITEEFYIHVTVHRNRFLFK